MSARDPRTFARFQENAFRGVNRAFLFFLLGTAVGLAGIVLLRSFPDEWPLEEAITLGGFGLLSYGLFLLLQSIVRRANDTIGVARALRSPEAAAPLPAAETDGQIMGRVILPQSGGRGANRLFEFNLGFAGLLSFGVAAGAIDLIVQPSHRSEPAVLFLSLFALLVPVLVLFGDFLRAIPGLWAETPSPRVGLTGLGLEGPFYPFAAYHPDGGTVVIRSPWFKFVRVRLPAPNQIPWKLLIVTLGRARGGASRDISLLSFSRAQLPIGMGGLQLSDGFLPAGGTGDPSLGYGMVVAIPRADLDHALWGASQGGSRLVAEFGQLTPAGQAAVRSARLEGNSRLARPFSGPWFVWLPSPRSESELGEWML